MRADDWPCRWTDDEPCSAEHGDQSRQYQTHVASTNSDLVRLPQNNKAHRDTDDTRHNGEQRVCGIPMPGRSPRHVVSEEWFYERDERTPGRDQYGHRADGHNAGSGTVSQR